jgi:hypothetical protein
MQWGNPAVYCKRTAVCPANLPRQFSCDNHIFNITFLQRHKCREGGRRERKNPSTRDQMLPSMLGSGSLPIFRHRWANRQRLAVIGEGIELFHMREPGHR